MIKTIFEFRKPGGEVYVRVPAEDGKGAAIQSCTLTECVNSTEELTIGSACANSLEATLLLSGSDPDIAAGDEVIVYKQDGSNEPVQMGVFVLEKPTRATANTMKLTGYDYVSKLDKDLTGWLSGLTEWPYTLTAFAKMVCRACGLNYKDSDVLNRDFPVQQFTRSGVTGRQIMQWLGEICARFCRATPDGKIEFAWYTESGKTITTGGELYYFQDGLSYEDYETAKVDAVQLRLANSDNGALWPEAADNANSYIITGNAILNSQITEDLLPVLANIQASVARAVYTPCKVSLPANLDIRAGNTVKITDKNGKTITAYVMTKTQTGQKDTLECTGAKLRNGTAAVNNQSPQQVAQQAVASQTQKDIYLKLTDNEKLKGLYMIDGELYINASFIRTGEFTAVAEVFLEPGEYEVETIKNHILGKATIPSARIPLYDFNNSGTVTGMDFLQAHSAALGKSSLANWSGAVKSEVTVTINPADPERAVLITGTNMWGRYVETVIGINASKSTFVSRELLESMINQESATDSLFRIVDGEKEYFNPPMLVGVEYRTTERYMGNPVYVQLVSFGALPNTTQRNKNVYYGGGTSGTKIHQGDIIDITGRAYLGYNAPSGSAGEWSAFPFVSGGKAIGADIWYDWTLGITVRTQSDLSGQLAWFTVKYTKTRV